MLSRGSTVLPCRLARAASFGARAGPGRCRSGGVADRRRRKDRRRPAPRSSAGCGAGRGVRGHAAGAAVEPHPLQGAAEVGQDGQAMPLGRRWSRCSAIIDMPPSTCYRYTTSLGPRWMGNCEDQIGWKGVIAADQSCDNTGVYATITALHWTGRLLQLHLAIGSGFQPCRPSWEAGPARSHPEVE